MYKEEITHYSECLSRDMHIMVYGHDGVPFLAFPTQDSLCHNYEEFGMINELSGYLEAGKIQYFVVDTIDKESPFAKYNACRAVQHAVVLQDRQIAVDMLQVFRFVF